MQNSPGPKIGEGATASVHAWAPGLVVKLFKPGVPDRLCRHEARITRAVFAAGALAPDVLDEVTIDGRPGFVMARLDGPSLLQSVKDKAVSFDAAGGVLAACLHAVHATSPPPRDVPHLRDVVAHGVRRAAGPLPAHIAAGVVARVESLAPGDGLCHGDPNPGNVIVTAAGPRLIDWIAAMRAPPAFDLASAQVMLTELAPSTADDPERPRAIHAAFRAAYADLAQISPETLAVIVAPYLPIVRALALAGGAVPAFAAMLLRRLEADFPT